MVRAFTDQELIDRMANLPSFKGFKDGFIDCWVRSVADEFNVFDDKAFTFFCENDKPEFMLVRRGTTNAGEYGLMHFEDYNAQGCAVLKSNEMVYGSHAHGLHHGKEAYVQVLPFPYFRDPNKNKKAEEIGALHTHEVIGANIHRAGANSTIIANWSTACMVTAADQDFERFLKTTKKTPRISLCILEEWAKEA